MFTYLFGRFLPRVFSLLRVGGLYIIYSSGLKVWVLLVQDTFRLPTVISAVVSIYLITSITVPQIPVLVLRPEFGARFAPSVHDDISLQNQYPLPLFPLTERRCHFRFRVLANRFASIFLLPMSGDSLGLLFLFTRVRLQSTDNPYFFLSSTAGRSWPTFFMTLLTVNLWRPANSNTEGSRNSLFLFSQ